jgi:hypothetical protein
MNAEKRDRIGCSPLILPLKTPRSRNQIIGDGAHRRAADTEAPLFAGASI